MHQNYHLIVMLNRCSYMFRRTNVIIKELTRSSQAICPCTVHYRSNNGISSEVAQISNFALWMQVDMVNCCWKQRTVVERCIICNITFQDLLYRSASQVIPRLTCIRRHAVRLF
jgi:hypothetical protein